jgi:hypothetical protein
MKQVLINIIIIIRVPLYRARDLVEEFEIESSPGLTKLLCNDPLDSIIEQGNDSIVYQMYIYILTYHIVKYSI